MFKKQSKNTETTLIDKEIQNVIDQMQSLTADSNEYSEMMDRLERLYKLKLSEQAEKKTVSPDALIAAGASLGGIILILSFEKANVLTSKAVGFVFKPKL